MPGTVRARENESGSHSPPGPTSRSREARSGKPNEGQAREDRGDADDDGDGDDDPQKPWSLPGKDHILRSQNKDSLPDVRHQLKCTNILERRQQFANEKLARVREETLIHAFRVGPQKALELSKRMKGATHPRNKGLDKLWDDYVRRATYDSFHDECQAGRESTRNVGALVNGTLSKEIDLGIIRRCIHFDRCCNPWADDERLQPLRPQYRITAIIKRMREYLSSSNDGNGRAVENLARLVAEDPRNPFVISGMVDMYLLHILNALVEAYQGDDSAYIDLLNTVNDTRGNILDYETSLVKIIKRENYLRFQQDHMQRTAKSKELRTRAGNRLRAELFQNVGRDGVVILGLFVDSVTLENLWAVKEIPASDLCDLGWKCMVSPRDDGMYYSEYYRPETYEVRLPKRVVEVQLGVSMDGEIIGFDRVSK